MGYERWYYDIWLVMTSSSIKRRGAETQWRETDEGVIVSYNNELNLQKRPRHFLFLD
jgi:hypothetical protein